MVRFNNIADHTFFFDVFDFINALYIHSNPTKTPCAKAKASTRVRARRSAIPYSYQYPTQGLSANGYSEHRRQSFVKSAQVSNCMHQSKLSDGGTTW